MQTVSTARMVELLAPYGDFTDEVLLSQLSVYLDLLIRWNERTNLTAIRASEEMVRRHFGESLFAAGFVGSTGSLLDLGSGAGFPGIPVALLRPEIQVTLAESQHKKAAFLREAMRVLGLPGEVWGARIETMPATRLFDVVMMRAVDQPGLALQLARARRNENGILVHLTTAKIWSDEASRIPGTSDGVVMVEPQHVPRGTSE